MKLPEHHQAEHDKYQAQIDYVAKHEPPLDEIELEQVAAGLITLGQIYAARMRNYPHLTSGEEFKEPIEPGQLGTIVDWTDS
jgi:hypothetical protein